MESVNSQSAHSVPVDGSVAIASQSDPLRQSVPLKTPATANLLPPAKKTALSPKKASSVWTLTISPKETNYGKSRSHISPPANLTRMYPDQGEQELWFNYEDREIYYPVILTRDGKKVPSHLGHVFVTMEISQKKQTPPAVVRTAAQKGVYWFKAIKAYVFGEIHVKFEVTDERPNIEPGNRVSAAPLSFACKVDVDEFGHPPPLQPQGTEGDTVVDYVYEFDPRQQQARMRQHQRTGPSRHVYQTYHTYVPHDPLNPAGASLKRRTVAGSGDSEYAKKTKYDATFLRPPRKSYKDYDEHAKPGDGSDMRSSDDFDDNGTARDSETGSTTYDSDKFDSESMLYPGDGKTGVGEGGRASHSAGGGQERGHGHGHGQGQGVGGRGIKAALGLDHALFDADPAVHIDPLAEVLGPETGGISSSSSSSSSSSVEKEKEMEKEKEKEKEKEREKERERERESAVQAYEDQIETLSNTIGVGHAMQCTRFAVAHLQFLERKERALPPDAGVRRLNVQQLRDLLKAKRSLEEALNLVLRRR